MMIERNQNEPASKQTIATMMLRKSRALFSHGTIKGPAQQEAWRLWKYTHKNPLTDKQAERAIELVKQLRGESNE